MSEFQTSFSTHTATCCALPITNHPATCSFCPGICLKLRSITRHPTRFGSSLHDGCPTRVYRDVKGMSTTIAATRHHPYLSQALIPTNATSTEAIRFTVPSAAHGSFLVPGALGNSGHARRIS